jgi:nicotinate-nucleotide pyrophosphorylase (carboxylating)
VRHPALAQSPFEPLTATGALAFRGLIENALEEDRARSDITTEATTDAAATAHASLVMRSPGVVAGLAIAALAFTTLDAAVTFEFMASDGITVVPNTRMASVGGRARSLLSAERVALNFFGRLCGIATLTRAYVEAVRGLPVRICDTRKTTPGLRALERYAVRAGGGYNHRFDLSDAVLIKDNHLATARSVAAAVDAARRHAGGAPVEVECESLDDVRAAVEGGADAVLLDNMPLDRMRESVQFARGHAAIEASGGVTLQTVRAIAETGVDVISVGALTHSAPSADVALDFTPSAEPYVGVAR